MKMIKGVLLIYFLLSGPVYSINRPVEIENFDIRYYHPANYGLKDLVFEIRVKNLLEQINKEMSLGTLSDVYYKIFWMMPGKYKIEVEGFPKGFKEIKTKLRNLIKSQLDFVIPQKLAPKVRSYSLVKSKGKSGTEIAGEDKTHTREFNYINLKFKKNGVLEELKMTAPNIANTKKYKMSAKGWSHNKWLIDESINEIVQGKYKTTQKLKVKYLSIDGFGFPKKITSTLSRSVTDKKLKKLIKNKNAKIESEFIFSKYEVNTGKAQRYITKGLKN